MANLKDAAHPLVSDTVVDVSRCYQCGKCSAGCVQAAEMDIPPSRVMRLLQTGSADDYRSVLSSKAIWLCLNCENCYERCPQSVDIPAVMDFLRQRSRNGTCSPGCEKDNSIPPQFPFLGRKHGTAL